MEKYESFLDWKTQYGGINVSSSQLGIDSVQTLIKISAVCLFIGVIFLVKIGKQILQFISKFEGTRRTKSVLKSKVGGLNSTRYNIDIILIG